MTTVTQRRSWAKAVRETADAQPSHLVALVLSILHDKDADAAMQRERGHSRIFTVGHAKVTRTAEHPKTARAARAAKSGKVTKTTRAGKKVKDEMLATAE